MKLPFAVLLLIVATTFSNGASPNETASTPAAAPFTPPADAAGDWAMQADEKLPNVLLLGDSISIGDTRAVRKLMQGRANVFRPMQSDGLQPENCDDRTMGLKKLDRWIGDRNWSVIHFNWGLWDLRYRDPASRNQGNRDKVKGKVSTTPADYRRQLEQLIPRSKVQP